jgi:LCP family protein required for cell wall assembly
VRVETLRVSAGRADLTWRTAASVALIVVLLVSLVSMAVAAIAAKGSLSSAGGVASQPGSIPWNGRDPLTMLVLGLNAPSPGPARATGMMVLSYSPSTRTERVLAIPGSLWVTVPGYGQDTLDNAYADGGPRLALLVAESVTNIPIPYYLAMGTTGLRQLIDAYGGVTVRDAAFASARNRTGGRHLSGNQAVSYVRAGGNGPGADEARMPRLQRVFLAIQHRALQPQSLFQIAATVDAVGGSVATNFPFGQIPALARALSATPESRIAAASLDYASGSVTDYSANGTRVLLPDWQRIHTLARRLFRLRLPPRGLVVLNGSGTMGEAQNLSQWLQQVGFHIARFGSAPSFNYAHTEVVVNSRARHGDMALARSTSALLQAPIVTRAVRYSRAPVIVIIGADYQELAQQ